MLKGGKMLQMLLQLSCDHWHQAVLAHADARDGGSGS
jgi:hypothetical protein